MSVIIRLQNLPWSANALDIRNFFRGLSIPEGGVHIVGGELGDAFIAFSTDEDARQGMMLDGGKIKEIQVRLLLSSRSEMHKVIEAARQSVPIMTLTAPAPPAPAPAPAPPAPAIPTSISSIPTPPVTPFSAALSNNSLSSSMSSFGIPGIGNPQEIPQPAVIEPPAPMLSPPIITTEDTEREDDKFDRKKDKDRKRVSKSRSRSRSRSRDRDRKDRKRDRRDRSRSRERRRRDRSRSRDRRDRKRDRKERSRSRDRSRERSPSRRSRDRRAMDRKSPQSSQDRERREITKPFEPPEVPKLPPANPPSLLSQLNPQQIQQMAAKALMQQNQVKQIEPNRFNDPAIADTYNKLQELGKKRNPNAFQGDPPNANSGDGGVIDRFNGGRPDNNARGPNLRRDGRVTRFANTPQRECCVAIRNAPNHTSYGDVRRFFPFMIDKHGIKMINDNMGRRTGTIFVRFCDSRSRQLAVQRKGNELKGAQVIVEPLDDDTYDVAIDSFLPYREENDEEEPTLVIADAPEQNQNQIPFTILKMTELPNFVKEHDIIKQFSDFSLLSIMLTDCRLTRSKAAFVQFVNPNDARLALERKDRIIFGRRHPTVVPISDEEYDKEKAQNEKPDPRTQNEPRQEEPPAPQMELTASLMEPPEPQREPPAPQREPVAPREATAPRDPRQRRFENAPPQSTPPQQPQFFPATPFMPGQQFAAPFAATPQFGGFPGPGTVDPRTAAANWANRPGFPNQIPGPIAGPMHKPVAIEDEPLDCVLMKGLPRDATDRTIVKFLSDTGAVPARIHLMLDGNGLPSGDCFCEFRSTEEARQAGTKHGHNLDGCRVTVDLVSRSVVEEALEGPKQPDIRDAVLGNGPMGNGIPLGNAPQQQFFEGPIRGGFHSRGGSSYRGRGSYDRGYDRGGYRGGFNSNRGGFDSSRGGFDSSRGGFDSSSRGFDSSSRIFDSSTRVFDSRGFDASSRFDSSSRGGFDSGRGGGYRGRGSYNDRGRGFDRGRGRGFSRGGATSRFENGREREQEEQDPALEDFGAPGCVVSMENVPFRATVEEILSFFSEFDLTQDDIIRRYNEKGQPTGDARVAFRTPFDAERAVKTRHMDTIHDRRINLMIL